MTDLVQDPAPGNIDVPELEAQSEFKALCREVAEAVGEVDGYLHEASNALEALQDLLREAMLEHTAFEPDSDEADAIEALAELINSTLASVESAQHNLPSR
jgi:hypothetical protein